MVKNRCEQSAPGRLTHILRTAVMTRSDGSATPAVPLVDELADVG
jgi:hypothetical protein